VEEAVNAVILSEALDRTVQGEAKNPRSWLFRRTAEILRRLRLLRMTVQWFDRSLSGQHSAGVARVEALGKHKGCLHKLAEQSQNVIENKGRLWKTSEATARWKVKRGRSKPTTPHPSLAKEGNQRADS
jgi:hypothetical protein